LHFNESLLKTLADERLIDLAQHERRLDALDRCLELLDETRQQLDKAAYLGESSMATGRWPHKQAVKGTELGFELQIRFPK